jgi:AraC-like DNA-binding protein
MIYYQMTDAADFIDLRCAAHFDGMEFVSAVYTRHEFSKHMHDTYAFGVIDEGTGGVWCTGRTHRGVPGDLISIAPGIVHTGAERSASDRTPFRYRMIYPSPFAVACAAECLEFSTAPVQRGEPMFRDSQVAGRFKALFNALLRGAPLLETEAHFLGFVAYLEPRSNARHRGHAAKDARAAAPAWITRVREYLDSNTSVNVRLVDIARIAGVHPLYLCRVFTAQVGLAPHAYAIHARLRQARELLRRGRPPSEVAAATGFADQSHLGRHFVRAVGVTPAKYRSMLRR